MAPILRIIYPFVYFSVFCPTRAAGSFCRESAYSLLTIRLQERFME